MPLKDLQRIAPRFKIIPKQIILHGDIHVDNYAWFKDKTDPDVKQYIAGEKAYTLQFKKLLQPLTDVLYAEMRDRIRGEDISVIEYRDDYGYYRKQERGKKYPLYFRKKQGFFKKEELLLDPNIVQKSYPFLSIAHFKVSPDNIFVAYLIDKDGSESYSLCIKKVTGGLLHTDEMQGVGDTFVFSLNSRSVFYTALDEKGRGSKVYKHDIGSERKADILVYEEPDEAFSLRLTSTKDHNYIIINAASNNTNELYTVNLKDSSINCRLVKPRKAGIEYYLEHNDGFFYILTNENAVNFKLIKQKADFQGSEEIIPHDEHVFLEAIEMFHGYVVAFLTKAGLPVIRVINLTDRTVQHLTFPEVSYAIKKIETKNFKSEVFHFKYSSWITPEQIIEYNMRTGKRSLKIERKIKGYKAANYLTERVEVRSQDGSLIPLDIWYKKGIKRDGKNPMLLSAYGAYGVSYQPYFACEKLSLLDRGFIFAFAYVRGGGEKGGRWYAAGKLLNKKNSFTDFIACTDYVLNNKYTSEEKLIIEGNSAGGLITGAVLNARTHLCRMAILKNPFLDVLNTMLDSSNPEVVSEYEEWGNPQLKEYYTYIKSYAPYENIQAKEYPHILIVAGENDVRVTIDESLKWVAKLRVFKKGEQLLVLDIIEGVGHKGYQGRSDFFKQTAFEYAFILSVLKET